MYKQFRKILSQMMVFALIITSCLIFNPPMAKATGVFYYVDGTNGDDNRTSAQAQNINTPWKTIQKAASEVVAGDTVYIRGGSNGETVTYCEKVTPANSGTLENPITYMPYNNESVTISGADAAGTSGWTLYKDNIYRKALTMSLGDGNQVFINGMSGELARWPDKASTEFNPFDTEPELATADAPEGSRYLTTDCTITDSDLASLNFSLVGCNLVVPAPGDINIPKEDCAWTINGTTITSHTAGSTTFSFDTAQISKWGKVAHTYYISGKLELLNMGNEWYYDGNYLYLQTPGGDTPANYNVEYKVRKLAFDLGTKQYINIVGLNLFAASIDARQACNCIIDKIHAEYVSNYIMSNEIIYKEAESFNAMLGVTNNGNTIADCDNGDWVCFNNMNLDIGYDLLTVNLAVTSQYAGQNLEIRLDSPTGILIGTLKTTSTGGFDVFQDQQILLKPIGGIHDVYIRFVGTTSIGIFDRFTFTSNNFEHSGIILGGTGNTMKNSTLAYSPGPLVLLRGTGNKVYNNLLHDGAYGAAGDSHNALIRVLGADHLISYNTAYRAGRACLGGNFYNCRIQYNDFYDAMKNTWDGGAIYIGFGDFGNSEIDHNLIHDTYSLKGIGIYLDNATRNILVYKNIIYRVSSIFGICGSNQSSCFQLVYNNTLVSYNAKIDGALVLNTPQLNDTYGSRFINNITCNGIHIEGTALIYNNMTSGDPQFNPDFTLQETSPAKDSGVEITGITDESTGLPDMGAIEGQATWSAGHNFTSPPNPTFETVLADYKNLVKNSGFEMNGVYKEDSSHEFDNWTKTGAGTALINAAEWALVENPVTVRSGYFGVQLPSSANGNGIEQTVTGLTPGTTYELSAWMRVSEAGGSAQFGVKDYGGNTVSVVETGTSWVQRKIKFSTGPFSTSATIHASNISGGAQSVYFDDFGLVHVDEQVTKRLQAEAYTSMSGIGNGGTAIGYCDNNDWVCYRNIDLGLGYDKFRTNAAVDPYHAGQTVEIRLDSVTGTLIGTMTISDTGGYGIYAEQTTALTGASGVHDIYICFKGTSGIGNFDWFQFETNKQKLQAEDYTSMSGIGNGGTAIGYCDNNDWICYQNVDLSAGYNKFRTNVAVDPEHAGQTVEIRLDSETGTLIGTITISNTGGWGTYAEQATALTETSGVHDVYICFKGTAGVGNFDWFQFEYDRLEAESYTSMNGIMNWGTAIGSCDNGDWVCFNNVNLGNGYKYFRAMVGVQPDFAGQTAEIRLDSVTGTLVGTMTLASTGGFGVFKEQIASLTGASGIHDVYVRFIGTIGAGNFDWFQFEN